MLTGQNITVVGAGIAGLTTALSLAGRGATVRVLEQSGEIAEVGAGLQISPNGVAVLDGLGFSSEIRAAAVPAEAVVLRDYRQGANILRLDFAKYAAGQDFLLMHRADLINLLAEGARARGVSIELGRRVNTVCDGKDGAVIRYDNGDEDQHSLVIGADGLRSRLRTALNGAETEFFTGQVAWRALVRAQGTELPQVSVYLGKGRHLVTYPLRDGQLINIVAVEERDAWADEKWASIGDPEELRRAFDGFCSDVQHLLARVTETNLWGLWRHPVAGCWHGAHSVLVGDAAHPTLPFLAQGANLALEDAWVLADCLTNMTQSQALRAYQLHRKSRVTRVIAAANANARNYHLQNPLLRGAVHSLLRTAGILMPGRVVRQFDWIYGHDVTSG